MRAGKIKPEAGPRPTGWTAPEPKPQKRPESGTGRSFAQNPGTGRCRIRVKTGHNKNSNGNCEGMIACLRRMTISSRPNRRTQGLESLSTGFGTQPHARTALATCGAPSASDGPKNGKMNRNEIKDAETSECDATKCSANRNRDSVRTE